LIFLQCTIRGGIFACSSFSRNAWCMHIHTDLDPRVPFWNSNLVQRLYHTKYYLHTGGYPSCWGSFGVQVKSSQGKALITYLSNSFSSTLPRILVKKSRLLCKFSLTDLHHTLPDWKSLQARGLVSQVSAIPARSPAHGSFIQAFWTITNS
jgi:hypothetical protein